MPALTRENASALSTADAGRQREGFVRLVGCAVHGSSGQ